MTIYLTELKDSYEFPSPYEALDEPNGLLAFGGDLAPNRILAGYQQGIFPWYGPGEPILWWTPSPRANFIPMQFMPSKSLKKFQRKHQYRVTINYATADVIKLCSAVRPAEETWLNEDMQRSYIELAKQGHCHSVEVWHDSQLVGGLYGIAVGSIFCGESMFSLRDNASKIALWYFCKHFTDNGGKLIDCQVMNPHLASLGAVEIEREDFLSQLSQYREQSLSPNTYKAQTLANPML